MTAPTTTPSEIGGPDREFFIALERMHGHRCPMSILGARLGFAARAALGETRGAGHRLSGRYHHRTCALDGIQLATQCTMGNGNLEVVPEGEHRLVLAAAGNPKQVEARLTDSALAHGRKYGRLREQLEELEQTLSAAVGVGVREQMAALLEVLESAPQEELVEVRVRSG